jgi:hypothetical protein
MVRFLNRLLRVLATRVTVGKRHKSWITRSSRDAPGAFTHVTGIVSSMTKLMIGVAIASLAGCAIVPELRGDGRFHDGS